MLINQIQKIGRAFYDEHKPVDILVEMQNPVRIDPNTDKKNILILEVDVCEIKNINFDTYFLEYDGNQKTKYLLGLTPGTATNYSLSLSPSYKKLSEKNRNKGNQSINFNKITHILKQKINKEKIIQLIKKIYPEEGNYINLILNILLNDSERVYSKIESFFNEKDIKKFNNPLLFKIKDKEGSKFLGEIPAMIKLYEFLYLGDIKATFEGAKCQLCGSDKSLREGLNIGLFTLDHDGFRTLFLKKEKGLSYQYILCTNCFLYTMLGYSIIRNKLNFYAYSLKEGRNSTSIYHYIIPMGKDIKLLKKQVEIIFEAKRDFNKEINDSMDKKVKRINSKLKEISRKISKESKKNLKKKIEKDKNELNEKLSNLKDYTDRIKNNFTIQDFINQLEKREKYIPILDLYYKITNQKLTPKSKEIVSEVMMSGEHLERLAKIFMTVSNSFSKPLRLSSLRKIVESKKFLHYYSSLISLHPVSLSNFQKDITKTIKSEFLTNITTDNLKIKNKNPYQRTLRTYEVYHALFSEAKLWRN